MGKPKFSRKKYETPSHPWEEDRIKLENELIKKYGLKNKSEAITHIIKKYEEEVMEPELRPEFIEKMLKIKDEKPIKVKDFKKRYGLK